MKIAKLFKEFPIFFFTFILMNPLLMSALRGEKVSAFKYFFQIASDDFHVIPCDLYIVIGISVLAMVLFSIKMPSNVSCFLKCFWYVVLAFSFVLRKFLLYEFGMDISPAVFSLVAETNSTESKGFIETFVLSFIGLRYFVGLLVLLFSIWFVERLWRKILPKSHFYIKRVFICCVGGFLGLMFVLNMMQINFLQGRSGQNTFSGLIFAYLKYSKDKTSSHQFIADMKSYNTQSVIIKNKDSLNIVFVVGESFIKSHAQVYGYPLPTMPNMQKEANAGNLFVFQDLISLFNKTTPSLQNAFCLNVLNGGAKWYQSCYWPLLMRKAGYGVYMWDNQKEGDKHYQGSFHEMYAPSVCELCYTKTNTQSSNWDEFIVKNFTKDNKKLSAKNFVYFHLQGQHNPFYNKYPKNRAKFSPEDYNRHEPWITHDILQTISDYDNSVLYTDYVLNLIIDMFKHTNAIVVFVSDHGEEVYDYRNKQGRAALDERYKSQFAHNQYDIPFLVWVSDKFKANNPNLCSRLSNSLNRPYSLDRIGHFFLDIAGIETKFYSSKDDILSNQFVKKDRYLYLSGQDRKLNYEKIK